jgi:hypothetical protein
MAGYVVYLVVDVGNIHTEIGVSYQCLGVKEDVDAVASVNLK